MLDTIRAMEEKLNRCRAAVNALQEALNAFNGVQDDLAALEAWFGSEEWFRCLGADERGELPPDLRRGVLSQDAIFDLLEETDALRARLQPPEGPQN